MIDLILFERILNADVGLIDQSDFLDNKLLTFLSSYKGSRVQELFACSPNAISYVYQWEHKCSDCGALSSLSTSKTKVLAYIQAISTSKRERGSRGKAARSWDRAKWILRCARCTSKYLADRDAEAAELRAQQAAREARIISSASEYLDPTNHWSEGFGMRAAFRHISDIFASANRDEIAKAIKQLEYNDFLKTPYWKAIASEVRRRAGFRCQLCKNDGELHVHHRSYENHGYELEMIGKDLICLCVKCHKTFHDERKVA